MTDKNAEEIDSMREQRGIAKVNFSVSAGGTNAAWGNAVDRNHCSDRFKRNALKVIEYYDEQGYLPMPSELELEPLGVLPKD